MKHNKSLRRGERRLTGYSRTVQIAARHMDRLLEDYEAITQFCLEQDRLKRISSHSAGLLHKLGVDTFQSEKEFCAELAHYDNGEDMVHMLMALRNLASPLLNRTKTMTYYKEVRSHLRGVRQELASVYEGK